MIAPALTRSLDPEPLGPSEARLVMASLLAANTTEAERCALLVALTARAAHSGEWAALATELGRRARTFAPVGAERAIDLCGSGGAPRPSFNVSTVSALVVAAAGQPVIKHGNRSSRGGTGSTDLLVALGLPVESSYAFARTSFRRHGIAFLHAPLYHPATAVVGPARRLLGVPTIFNRLGPLTNPAPIAGQLVGWGNPREGEVVVAALRERGVRRGLTMFSEEGCDEFSPNRPSGVISWWGKHRSHRVVRPSAYLLPDERKGPWGPLAPPGAAEETERILAGGGGARRGAVVLTSGAALWVGGQVSSLFSGVRRAREVLDSGAPEQLLAELRETAGDFAAERA